jgi:hypothetical protein
MRAMNATELKAVFGGTSGIEPATIDVQALRVDPMDYPQCPATPAPSDPETWPGDPYV